MAYGLRQLKFGLGVGIQGVTSRGEARRTSSRRLREVYGLLEPERCARRKLTAKEVERLGAGFHADGDRLYAC
jgi:hypothetical protein